MHDLTALQVQRFDLVVELFDRLDVSTDEVLDIAEFVLGDAAEAEDDAHGPIWTPALGSATFEDCDWATHGGYDEVNDNDTVDQPLNSKAWVDALLDDHAVAAAKSEAARLDRQAALRRHPSFRSAAQADAADHYGRGGPVNTDPLPSGRFDDVEVSAWLRDLDYSALSDAVYAADEETLDVLDPDSNTAEPAFVRIDDDGSAEVVLPTGALLVDDQHISNGFYHYGSIDPSDFKPVVR